MCLLSISISVVRMPPHRADNITISSRETQKQPCQSIRWMQCLSGWPPAPERRMRHEAWGRRRWDVKKARSHAIIAYIYKHSTFYVYLYTKIVSHARRMLLRRAARTQVEWDRHASSRSKSVTVGTSWITVHSHVHVSSTQLCMVSTILISCTYHTKSYAVATIEFIIVCSSLYSTMLRHRIWLY